MPTCSMAPLMEDIRDLENEATEIRGGKFLDDLDSLSHVRMVGLFIRIIQDPEMMAQVKYLMEHPEVEFID